MKRIQLYLPDNVYATLTENKANTTESLSKITRDIFELGYPLWRNGRTQNTQTPPRGLLDAERIAIMASAETLVLLRKIAETIDPGFVDIAKKETSRFMRDKWKNSDL